MKSADCTKGKLVYLHEGRTTRSPRNGTVYEIVDPPTKQLDFVTIRDYLRGGNVYNVGAQRLSPAAV